MTKAQEVPCQYFPGGSVVKNLPANAGDTGWISGWETKIHLGN